MTYCLHTLQFVLRQGEEARKFVKFVMNCRPADGATVNFLLVIKLIDDEARFGPKVHHVTVNLYFGHNLTFE